MHSPPHSSVSRLELAVISHEQSLQKQCATLKRFRSWGPSMFETDASVSLPVSHQGASLFRASAGVPCQFAAENIGLQIIGYSGLYSLTGTMRLHNTPQHTLSSDDISTPHSTALDALAATSCPHPTAGHSHSAMRRKKQSHARGLSPRQASLHPKQCL